MPDLCATELAAAGKWDESQAHAIQAGSISLQVTEKSAPRSGHNTRRAHSGNGTLGKAKEAKSEKQKRSVSTSMLDDESKSVLASNNANQYGQDSHSSCT